MPQHRYSTGYDQIDEAFDGDMLAQVVATALCDRGYKEERVVALMGEEDNYPEWDRFAMYFIDPLEEQLGETP